jgi:hypothetical protein
VHDNVLLPDPATLLGDKLQLVLLLAKLTVPVKHWRAVIVIVEDAAVPAFTVMLVGDAAIVKSWTVNVTVAVCDKLPLVPVTVTWTNCADANVQLRLELPEPVTLVGDNVQLVLLLVNETTPLKPWRPVTVILEVPADPAFTVTLVGDAAIVKSCTV